ncbi:L-Ala-D/L-Glu epimerase [Caldisericum exile]|uniref:Dipeptide epimerase n=1 Tax=Caldisericum exile (strain DSM 21853 / NBRC 104410 / AZM16c01) TaxID=511051 RepID=A0A7U6JEG1_CALEA|nr:L-Ala-D/L-Glu epimerase [Caldisericum exile]BAL80418.1 mandelate racemase/muconate lactonizing enzyme family protein [Caldisericum exile AZM16c01]
MGKIKNISLKQITTKFKKPFHVTNSISTEAINIRVFTELESNVIGVGEASPSFRVNGEEINALLSMENFLNTLLNGEDVKSFRKCFLKTSKLLATPSLKAAVEFSIIDALAKELGTTPHIIFGGAETSLETDKTVSIEPLEERVSDTIEIFNEGFRIIKVKVGENLKEDIEAMLRISKETKGAKYIVDANMGYTPKEALTFEREMYRNGVDIAIFEQPVAYFDFDGLKYVRFHSHYPVAADESVKTPMDALRLIQNEAVDFFNIKLMKSGISSALSIVELAKTSNIGLMIGAMAETSIGITQSVHFALGVGGFKYFDLDTIFLLNEEKFEGNFIVEKPFYRIA